MVNIILNWSPRAELSAVGTDSNRTRLALRCKGAYPAKSTLAQLQQAAVLLSGNHNVTGVDLEVL